jgi:hypothetical protein
MPIAGPGGAKQRAVITISRPPHKAVSSDNELSG